MDGHILAGLQFALHRFDLRAQRHGAQVVAADGISRGGNIACRRDLLRLIPGGKGDILGDLHARGIAAPAGKGVVIPVVRGTGRRLRCGDRAAGVQLAGGDHGFAVIVIEGEGILRCALVMGIERAVTGRHNGVRFDLRAAGGRRIPAEEGAAVPGCGRQFAVDAAHIDLQCGGGAFAAVGVEGDRAGLSHHIERLLPGKGAVGGRRTGGGDTAGVTAGFQTAEGHGAVQPAQIVALGVDARCTGRRNGVGVILIINNRYGDLLNIIGTPQGTAEGIAGVALRQTGGVGRAAKPLQRPVAACALQLPLGGGAAHFDGAAGGEGRRGKICTGTAVFQREAAAGGGSLPHLVVVGRRRSQRDRAVAVGRQPLAGGHIGDGVVAAGIVGQGKTLRIAVRYRVHRQTRAACHGAQLGVGGHQDTVGALPHLVILIAVIGQHCLRVRRLVDAQTDIYAQLHIATAAAVPRHALAADAVALGCGAGHLYFPRIGQAAGFGVDGVDQFTLGLIFEAADGGKGILQHLQGAAGAVLYGAGPEHIAQGNAVVADLEAGDIGLRLGDDGVIIAQAHIVALRLFKTAGIIRCQLLPCRIKLGAIAGSAVIIRLAERVAKRAVEQVVGFLAPFKELLGYIIRAGELIRTVGLAAGVALSAGDHTRAGSLVGGAERAQQGLLLVVGCRGRSKQEQ